MAKTPEAKVKDKIKGLLKQVGAYYTMPVMTGMASNGTPDFVVCHCCQFIGIEAKAAGGKPTELQKVRLREIMAAGGIALVINERNLPLLVDVLALCSTGNWSGARMLSNLHEWL